MRRRPLVRRSTFATGVALAVSVTGALGAGSAGAATQAPAPRFAHPLVSVHSPGTAFAASTSNNWSGYNQGELEKSTTFTSISAQWTVPTAKQHTKGQSESSATWIGIGGGCVNTSCTATDSTLIQAGTEQDVAANGAVSYAAWWEAVPAPSIDASITVHAGDVIACSISQGLPEVWSITLRDVTDGQSFTETVPYSSTYLTAEWILETPVVVGTGATGIATLPTLSTTHFSHATVNGKPAGLVSAEAIDLVDSAGQALATPSKPAAGATAFNDCSYATACAAPKA